MNESFVRSLAVSLPPELEKLKGAGYFDEFAEKAKNHLMRDNLPDIVKERILVEIHNAEIIKCEYRLSEKQLIAAIAKYAPGFGEKDFEKLALDTDYVFINGRKKYASLSVSSLFITSKLLREWPGSTYPKDDDQTVADSRKLMKKNGSATVVTDIEYTCKVKKAYADGNMLRIHLPYPNPQGSGVKSIEFVSSSQKCRIAPGTAPQRTAYFEADGSKTRDFSVRVKTVFTETYMSYKDILEAGKTVTAERETELLQQVRASDLEEKAPHYVFTPFIEALSDMIVGKETDKTKIARKIYDFITHKCTYAYVRDYASIDQLPEYFGLRGRGDCGLQASLFITLCRYNGIPARWESGICTDGKSGGSHDWALCYFKGVGFRPVDPSFGGAAVRRGSKADNDFYFGNIDPYRMVFNCDIQEPFIPAKKFYRNDPYDNQIGEAETSLDMLENGEAVFGRRILSRIIE